MISSVSSWKWTFQSFVTSTGRKLVHDWYAGQSPAVQAAFDTALEYLRDQPIAKWVRPYAAVLSGDCNGLVEIRFKAEKVQHRPLGFFRPEQIFTIVYLATERDGQLVPPSACMTALARKGIVETTRGRCCEWDV